MGLWDTIKASAIAGLDEAKKAYQEGLNEENKSTSNEESSKEGHVCKEWVLIVMSIMKEPDKYSGVFFDLNNVEVEKKEVAGKIGSYKDELFGPCVRRRKDLIGLYYYYDAIITDVAYYYKKDDKYKKVLPEELVTFFLEKKDGCIFLSKGSDESQRLIFKNGLFGGIKDALSEQGNVATNSLYNMLCKIQDGLFDNNDLLSMREKLLVDYNIRLKGRSFLKQSNDFDRLKQVFKIKSNDISWITNTIMMIYRNPDIEMINGLFSILMDNCTDDNCEVICNIINEMTEEHKKNLTLIDSFDLNTNEKAYHAYIKTSIDYNLQGNTSKQRILILMQVNLDLIHFYLFVRNSALDFLNISLYESLAKDLDISEDDLSLLIRNVYIIRDRYMRNCFYSIAEGDSESCDLSKFDKKARDRFGLNIFHYCILLKKPGILKCYLDNNDLKNPFPEGIEKIFRPLFDYLYICELYEDYDMDIAVALESQILMDNYKFEYDDSDPFEINSIFESWREEKKEIAKMRKKEERQETLLGIGRSLLNSAERGLASSSQEAQDIYGSDLADIKDMYYDKREELNEIKKETSKSEEEIDKEYNERLNDALWEYEEKHKQDGKHWRDSIALLGQKDRAVIEFYHSLYNDKNKLGDYLLDIDNSTLTKWGGLYLYLPNEVLLQ